VRAIILRKDVAFLNWTCIPHD